MKPPIPFSHEEDREMWRFALRNYEKYNKHELWKQFKNRTGSDRLVSALFCRFEASLFARLPQTKFHTETKLKFCIFFEMKVGESFLKELTKDADVELNSDGIVTKYTLRSCAGPNRDGDLDDEAINAIVPLMMKVPLAFTADEDMKIWNYLIEHPYTTPRAKFWTDFRRDVDSTRSFKSFSARFINCLAPNLHKTCFDIETKLKLYKNVQVTVNKEYLKVLKDHAELEIDEAGCITSYKLIPRNSSDGSAKRKIDLVTDQLSPKKFRMDCHDDMLLKKEIAVTNPETGVTNPDIMIMSSPKVDETVDCFHNNNYSTSWIERVESSSCHDQNHVRYSTPIKFEDPEEFPDPENKSGIRSSDGDFENGLIVKDECTRESHKPTETQEEKVRFDRSILQPTPDPSLFNEFLFDKLRDVVVETMSSSIKPLEKRIKSLEERLAHTRNTRNESDTQEENEEKGAPSIKQYLKNLKSLVTSLKSPEMEGIEQRIEAAISEMPEDDEQPLPTRLIRSMFEEGLTMIGR